MRVLDEEPKETIHLFVVNEDDLLRKPDYFSIFMAFFAFLYILAIISINIFTATPAERDVSFTLTIQGFRLTPVTKTLHTMVVATGKGRTPATTAVGIITFYNGAIYTQIIPVGTILKGSDGVSVITDQEAVIPSAAQTTPPTYGHTNVLAQSLSPGEIGNIQAGDINEACCVTSVIAQNPYAFTGGKNARTFTYLTEQDVKRAVSPLLPTLQSRTLSILPTPHVLNPTCTTVTTSSPSVGKETQSSQLTLVETCSADSYSVNSVSQAITTYSRKFGKGALTHVQFFVVGVRNEAVTLYVAGRWQPFAIRRIWTGK
ncbi:MAG TPA: baseplate J/gp47 family protein [Ktedonobacteraceae bacterium]